MGHNTKVYLKQGGEELVVTEGGMVVLGGVTFAVDDGGNVVVSGVPTADPEVAGALWSDGGVLTISGGE